MAGKLMVFRPFLFCQMKKIIFENEHRRKHFEFFRNMNHPHFSLTANVDISPLLKVIKKEGLPFMPTLVWVVSKVVNGIPQLRQRIREEEVVEHEKVHPSFAVDTEGTDVFSFCEVKYLNEYQSFIKEALAKIEKMKTAPSFEDEPGRDDYLFLSSIPWVSFTSVSHAMHFHPHDSVPRIIWGKYFASGEKTQMPLSIQAHHALVDGRHVGQFFDGMSEICSAPEKHVL